MTSSATTVERFIIPHSAFIDAERRIEQCFDFSTAKGEAEGLAVIGESRTGKTSVLTSFAARHKPYRTSDGMQVPILFASVPSAPTVKSLAGVMLEALQVQDPERGTENERTRRLRTLMRECGTKMVMIDEFQHFVDQGTHKVMHHVADWLKRLIDDTRTTLVIAGLPSCMAVIDQNPQLAGRFMAPIQMTRFHWQEPRLRRQFIAILQCFHKQISQEFDLPDLASEEMAFRVYLATGGLMGYVAKLLRHALRNAAGHDRRAPITLRDLHNAHMEAIWSAQRNPDLPKPFDARFHLERTIEVLDRVSRIGTFTEETATPRRKVRQGRRERSLNDILCAK